jgi:hypothetical protein
MPEYGAWKNVTPKRSAFTVKLATANSSLNRLYPVGTVFTTTLWFGNRVLCATFYAY